MNYWLINPKNNGSYTNLSDLKPDCVYMGWDEYNCPKFYNDVKKDDIIIVAEGAHNNSTVHFIGIAEKLDKENKCWHMLHSTQEINEEVAHIIRNEPSDFGGRAAKNPWGPTKSIIKLNDNPAENKIKSILNKHFEIVKMKEKLQQHIGLLASARNLILTGAPGTGKTFLAQQIAAQMILGKELDEKTASDEDKDKMNEQYDFVQFHPSIDYTDFVEGLRPKDNNGNISFRREDGIFMRFCRKALKANEKKEAAPKYVFVIDEINRGDLSKIFGELFFSIDPGYRGEKVSFPEIRLQFSSGFTLILFTSYLLN